MPRARKNNVTDEQILEAYSRLNSTPKVMAELDVGSATIVRVLDKNGIKRTGRRGREWSAGEYPGRYEGSSEDIVLMYRMGLSLRTISERIGRSTSVVIRRLKQAGISSRPYQGSGPDHSMWSGGRVPASQGYFRVWLDENDPMSCMRTAKGYVLEHRLVMARSIGRPLLDSETVHHINGDQADNRIENLQLRQGRHGKNVVMACADCGSHNIVHKEL